MGGLTSHCYERLYTLGIDRDERIREMDRRREGENDYRKRVSPIRVVQTLDVFNREL